MPDVGRTLRTDAIAREDAVGTRTFDGFCLPTGRASSPSTCVRRHGATGDAPFPSCLSPPRARDARKQGAAEEKSCHRVAIASCASMTGHSIADAKGADRNRDSICPTTGQRGPRKTYLRRAVERRPVDRD